MSSLKATADALAGRFTGVTATVGSVTEAIAIGPTASLPNTIGNGPALLVYHPAGVLDLETGHRRNDTHDFPVRLLRDPMTYPERSDWLYAWYDALRDRVEMDMDLGLSYVAWAQPRESNVELDGGKYADGVYDLVEFIVRVRFLENVATVAI